MPTSTGILAERIFSHRGTEHEQRTGQLLTNLSRFLMFQYTEINTAEPRQDRKNCKLQLQWEAIELISPKEAVIQRTHTNTESLGVAWRIFRVCSSTVKAYGIESTGFTWVQEKGSRWMIRAKILITNNDTRSKNAHKAKGRKGVYESHVHAHNYNVGPWQHSFCSAGNMISRGCVIRDRIYSISNGVPQIQQPPCCCRRG